MPKTASGKRMAVYYAFLAVAVTVVTILVVHAGEDRKAQPSIAGGYDLEAPNPCIGAPAPPAPSPALPATTAPQAKASGPSFDVKQSGQFVNLSNTQGNLGGKLRLKEDARPDGSHPLSGDVDCVNGKTLDFEGEATPGAKGTITGLLGGQKVAADLKRDPPEPGAAKPRAPGSIAGIYKLSPRSTCFGGKIELDGQRFVVHR